MNSVTINTPCQTDVTINRHHYISGGVAITAEIGIKIGSSSPYTAYLDAGDLRVLAAACLALATEIESER